MPDIEQPAIPTDLLALTCSMVSAYVAHNATPPTALPGLIADAHAALMQIVSPGPVKATEATAALVPAVPIKKSVTDDYIVCLDDGRKLKSLKRHLAKLGMTPDEYRAKWGLPKDYPMVAPSYREARMAIAKASGLGRKAPANQIAA